MPALVAEYLIEDLARIPVEVEYASNSDTEIQSLQKNDIVIAISQSGETADTLAAIELAKSKGAIIYGVCNVVGSSISRMTHAGSYTHAGPEIGVASTKAFTAQVSILSTDGIADREIKGTITESKFHEYIAELEAFRRKLKRY